jgi:hypothetical protein
MMPYIALPSTALFSKALFWPTTPLFYFFFHELVNPYLREIKGNLLTIALGRLDKNSK